MKESEAVHAKSNGGFGSGSNRRLVDLEYNFVLKSIGCGTIGPREPARFTYRLAGEISNE